PGPRRRPHRPRLGWHARCAAPRIHSATGVDELLRQLLDLVGHIDLGCTPFAIGAQILGERDAHCSLVSMIVIAADTVMSCVVGPPARWLLGRSYMVSPCQQGAGAQATWGGQLLQGQATADTHPCPYCRCPP